MKKINPFLVYADLPREMYIIFVSRIINCIGFFIMPLLVLILTQKIGYTVSQAGVISTIAAVSQAPFVILGGKLVDQLGSKKIIVFFSILGAVIYFVCSLMHLSLLVVILIIIASDMHAVAQPAFNTYIAFIVPSDQLKKAYSLNYLGFNLGLAVGPILGGLLFQNHLTLLFILDACTTLLATALIMFYIKNVQVQKTTSTLSKESSDQSHQESALGFLCRHHFLLYFTGILFIINFCYSQWYFVLPMQTAQIFNNGIAFYGMLVSINAIIVIIFTPVLTHITNKMHPFAVILIGALLYVAAFALFAINQFIVVFLVSIFILSIGEVLITININSYIAASTPPALLGRMDSLITILSRSGSSAGPIITGMILMSVGFSITWIIIAALMLFGAFSMYLMLKGDRKTDQKQVTIL